MSCSQFLILQERLDLLGAEKFFKVPAHDLGAGSDAVDLRVGLFVWVAERSGKFHNLGLTQRQLLRAQDGSKRINAGHVIVGALAQFIHSPAGLRNEQ
jgi:hypothetical protein